MGYNRTTMDNQEEQNRRQDVSDGAGAPADGTKPADGQADEDPTTLKKELGDLGIEINPDESAHD